MTISERVEKLLSQMTLEEKVAQMVQVPYTSVGREEALRWAKLGAGSFLHVLGDDAREVQQAARSSRLGIPVLFGIDAIHGHGLNEHATIFPSQLASACAWSRETVQEMGRVTAREVATDGLHWTFSPVLCLGRDTRWGRIDETFGEDPYLAGELGAAIIHGYQGDDLSAEDSILACAKHYIAYGEAVGARDACDTEITERKLREVFLPPFRKAVEAGVATIMTAYGSMDGTPFTINRRVMKEILRDEMGFDGFVVTDWDNVQSLMTRQHVCGNLQEASTKAAQAGNDMMMTTIGFYDAALEALRAGELEEQVIDEAVRHILTVKFRMGLFEHPEKKGAPGCIGCVEHREAALRAARQSVTLLRNQGVLPLKDGVRKVAVIGENADRIQAQYGDWTYFTHPTPGLDRKPMRPYVTLREGVEGICQERGMACVYHRGCSVLPGEYADIPGAVQAASDADVIILAVGDRVELHGEYHDRADLALSGDQAALFRALKATGIPVVTVLISGKPLCLGDVAEQADAVLCGFNGGMYGGQALAEAIFGCLNPEGRLPISFPRHSGQVPVYYNTLPGWHGGRYVDQKETPLFAFGEGMGYAPFTYENLTMDKETLMAQVDVENTGSVSGTETVQVYFRDEVSSVMTPVKQLIAFQKVTLEPGERKTVCFQLRREDFSMVRSDGVRVTEPGDFTLMVGHSSKDEDLQQLAFRL